MKKSILQQLFDGEICPSENIYPDTPEYNEAKKSLSEEKELLLDTLSGETLERFKKIDDLHYDISGMYGYECFAHGFTIGTLIMLEVMKGKERIYNNEGG